MGNQALLEIDNVSKSYGSTRIVDPFSLTMNKSNIIALCGGNGAGKSTIIKMVTGLTQPITGTIRINGLLWRKERMNYAKQLGYMPDDFHFQEALSVFEYLSFYASLKKSTKYVKETLEIVGLWDKKSQLISKLSKGMRQRLLLAQAMVSKPKLLLLDEPTNGLDPHWIKTFQEIIICLKNNGQSILFSTHNIAVAEAVSDQVIFLRNGVIIEKVNFMNGEDRDLSKYYKAVFA
ncbi:MAG: ABC transporter ATP-binding protein [Anaerobacillus sp.]|uniref:ABC transporter ATP-binding protein n=1 Tax=Anaerobacillus sp. TaxID=1872506 RepID=UPI00391CB3FD